MQYLKKTKKLRLNYQSYDAFDNDYVPSDSQIL